MFNLSKYKTNTDKIISDHKINISKRDEQKKEKESVLEKISQEIQENIRKIDTKMVEIKQKLHI